MVGNGGWDDAFCLKLSVTDCQGQRKEWQICGVIAGFGLLQCAVWDSKEGKELCRLLGCCVYHSGW